ncbi:nodulation-signaling pathway 2 protein-like, partial [Trifolium medium]|nr:nodulation-signaling pathway 2 protein-like [Trifolium medium]
MYMEMDMDAIHDLDFSGHSTLTNTPSSDDDYGCNWNQWSPIVNWDTFTEKGQAVGDDIKGLKLVHLLMAGAEALTGSTKNRDLARVILVRLKELVSNHAHGSNMERL